MTAYAMQSGAQCPYTFIYNYSLLTDSAYSSSERGVASTSRCRAIALGDRRGVLSLLCDSAAARAESRPSIDSRAGICCACCVFQMKRVRVKTRWDTLRCMCLRASSQRFLAYTSANTFILWADVQVAKASDAIKGCCAQTEQRSATARVWSQ